MENMIRKKVKIFSCNQIFRSNVYIFKEKTSAKTDLTSNRSRFEVRKTKSQRINFRDSSVDANYFMLRLQKTL